MGEKLLQGDRLPKVTFHLLNGETITLPDDAPTRYTALLFYRGYW
jgi:peroxiredoxin